MWLYARTVSSERYEKVEMVMIQTFDDEKSRIKSETHLYSLKLTARVHVLNVEPHRNRAIVQLCSGVVLQKIDNVLRETAAEQERTSGPEEGLKRMFSAIVYKSIIDRLTSKSVSIASATCTNVS